MNAVVKFALLLVVAGAGLLTFGAYATSQGGVDAEKRADTMVQTDNLPEGQATAVFAMGCFWCAESDFEKVDGVIDVVSGYTGGTLVNPTYQEVTYFETGHYEAVLVTYDTSKLDYSDLLSVFWKNVDPFDEAGQFCDKGSSYRAAIFPGSREETRAAKRSKERWSKALGRDIVTAIAERDAFYLAEDYHQDYYKKNPLRYNYYRNACGRDKRLEAVWGDVAKK